MDPDILIAELHAHHARKNINISVLFGALLLVHRLVSAHPIVRLLYCIVGFLDGRTAFRMKVIVVVGVFMRGGEQRAHGRAK